MRATPSGIEVSASGIKVVLAGFDLFPSLVQKLLVTHGLLRPGETAEGVAADRWFPLEVWLGVHTAIRDEIGPNALFTACTRILSNPSFPAGIRDIDGALHAIDIAYHRSHRKAGVPMFDPATSAMTEGIGHYRARRVPPARIIEITSDSVYPCEADFGIVTRLATQFEARANIAHDPGRCRNNGGASCIYLVTW